MEANAANLDAATAPRERFGLPPLEPLQYAKIKPINSILTISKSQGDLRQFKALPNSNNIRMSELFLTEIAEPDLPADSLGKANYSSADDSGSKHFLAKVAHESSLATKEKQKALSTKLDTIISRFKAAFSPQTEPSGKPKRTESVVDSWRRKVHKSLYNKRRELANELDKSELHFQLVLESCVENFSLEIGETVTSINDELLAYSSESVLKQLSKNETERIWKRLKAKIDIMSEQVGGLTQSYNAVSSERVEALSKIVDAAALKLQELNYMNPPQGIREVQELAGQLNMHILEQRKEAYGFFKQMEFHLLEFEKNAKAEYEKLTFLWRATRFKHVTNQYVSAIQSSERQRKDILNQLREKWNLVLKAAEDHILLMNEFSICVADHKKHAIWMAKIDDEIFLQAQEAVSNYVAQLLQIEHEENDFIEKTKLEFQPLLAECNLYKPDTLADILDSLSVRTAKLNIRPNCSHVSSCLKGQTNLLKAILKVIGMYYWCIQSRRAELDTTVERISKVQMVELLRDSRQNYLEALQQFEKLTEGKISLMETADDENLLLQLLIEARGYLDQEEQLQNTGLAQMKGVIEQMSSSVHAAVQSFKGFMRDFAEKLQHKTPFGAVVFVNALSKAAGGQSNSVKHMVQIIDSDLALIAKSSTQPQYGTISEEDESILASTPLVSTDILQKFLSMLLEHYKEDINTWATRVLATVQAIRDCEWKDAVNLYNQYFYMFEQTREKAEFAFKKRKANLSLVQQQKVNNARNIETNFVKLKNTFLRELDKIEAQNAKQLASLLDKYGAQFRNASTQGELDVLVKEFLPKDIAAINDVLTKDINAINRQLLDGVEVLKSHLKAQPGVASLVTIDYGALEDLPSKYGNRIQKLYSDINSCKENVRDEFQKAASIVNYILKFKLIKGNLNTKSKAEKAVCTFRTSYLENKMSTLKQRWSNLSLDASQESTIEALFKDLDEIRSQIMAHGVYLKCLFPKVNTDGNSSGQSLVKNNEGDLTKLDAPADSKSNRTATPESTVQRTATPLTATSSRSGTVVDKVVPLFGTDSLESASLAKQAWDAFYWLKDCEKLELDLQTWHSLSDLVFGPENMKLTNEWSLCAAEQVKPGSENMENKVANARVLTESHEGQNQFLFRIPSALEPVLQEASTSANNTDIPRKAPKSFSSVVKQMVADACIADESLLNFELKVEIARREFRLQMAQLAESFFAKEKGKLEKYAKPDVPVDKDAFWTKIEQLLEANSRECTMFWAKQVQQYEGLVLKSHSLCETLFEAASERLHAQCELIGSKSWKTKVASIQKLAFENQQKRDQLLHALRFLYEMPDDNIMLKANEWEERAKELLENLNAQASLNLDNFIRYTINNELYLTWGLVQLSTHWVQPENVNSRALHHILGIETSLIERVESTKTVSKVRRSSNTLSSLRSRMQTPSTQGKLVPLGGIATKVEVLQPIQFISDLSGSWMPEIQQPLPNLCIYQGFWADLGQKLGDAFETRFVSRAKEYRECLFKIYENEKAKLEQWHELYINEFKARKEAYNV